MLRLGRSARGWLRLPRNLGCVLILLAATGCFFGGELITERMLEDAERRRYRGAASLATSTPTPLSFTPTAIPTRTPGPGRTLATVRRVWDGNTVLIDGGYSVRYIGVNAPGAGMFGRPLEPFGRAAAERNLELVEGKEVELEEDAVDLDSSGFLLRYVYVDHLMVNEVLLREGLARLAPLGGNVRYAERLRLAERDARREPLNIWTLVTPTATPAPTSTPTDTPTLIAPPIAPRSPTPTAIPPGPVRTATPLR